MPVPPLALTDRDLAHFMRAALAEAEAAGQAGEIPIGAVVVLDGQVIARGRARHQARQSQLAHAELQALLEGGPALWTEYRRAALFTTVEPCPMCLGAVVMADVPHIIFACPDAVVRSADTLTHNPYVRRHIHTYRGGVLEAEARALIARYDPAMLDYITTGQPGANLSLRGQTDRAGT
jgi:tRNA(adenine34) deaminase